MSPSGLGLRLKSLQLQPGLALVGDRCPFTCPLPFGANEAGFCFGVDFVVDVRALILRVCAGLRLRVRARRRSSWSSSISSSIGSGDCAALFFADLVVGPLYSLLAVSHFEVACFIARGTQAKHQDTPQRVSSLTSIHLATCPLIPKV